MTDTPRKRRNRNPNNATTRLNDTQLATFDELFGPGFSQWYRATHDADGKVLPSGLIPGLTPPQYEGDETDE